RPAAYDRALALSQARGRYLHFDGRDVVIHERVNRGEFCGRVELGCRVLDIDQVEGLAEVNDKRIAALSDEDVAEAVAAGNADVPNMLVGVGEVIRDRLHA